MTECRLLMFRWQNADFTHIQMLLHEPDRELSMGDNASDNDTDSDLDLDQTNDVTESRDDVISVISEANSFKSTKSKKRVQFPPDCQLVRVREIPPRSNKSSDESDGSASDTDSEGDTDSTVSESASDRDSPSPAAPVKTVSDTNFTTMPPLVYHHFQDKEKPTPTITKQSYAISRSTTRNTAMVAKITGIHTSAVPPEKPKISTRKVRRTPSPRLDKRPKKQSIRQIDKGSSGKVSPDEARKQNRSVKKKIPVSKKEAKVSASLPNKSKAITISVTKATLTAKPTVGLMQRRINSAPANKSSLHNSKHNHNSNVSTSLTVLSSNMSPTTSSTSDSMDRVGRAMQSLNMGKLYTIDGFIFPTHQVNTNLHLPDLHSASVKQDEDFFYVNGRRSSSDNISPRREVSRSLDYSNSKQPLSPSSANRKRRYAWQMANGGIHNTLNNCPTIAQMWDNVPQSSMSSSFPQDSLQVTGKPSQGTYYARGKS